MSRRRDFACLAGYAASIAAAVVFLSSPWLVWVVVGLLTAVVSLLIDPMWAVLYRDHVAGHERAPTTPSGVYRVEVLVLAVVYAGVALGCFLVSWPLMVALTAVSAVRPRSEG